MRIGYASQDWSTATSPPTPGGAGWYRCALPARALRDLGHQTWHGTLAARPSSGEWCVQTWDGALHESLDIVVLQRYMHRDVLEDISRARATGQRIVNDVDDWFWGLSQANRAWATTHPKANPDENRDIYARIIAAGDAITCSTAYLQRRLAKQFPHLPVHLVRNAIDADRFPQEPVRPISEGLTVGWVGATSWRSNDLEILAGILDGFLERSRSVFLHAGDREGAVRAGTLLRLSKPYAARPLVPIGQYPRLFAGIDIGIAPMSDTPFNHAKSCVKGMEYAAAGVSFVASELPEYEWFGVGSLARRAHDWKRALERLRDPNARVAQRLRARTRLSDLSIDRCVEQWLNVYQQILTTERTRGNVHA